MKVRTLLAMSKDKFNVALNDVDMFELKRYQKKDEDEEAKAGELSKISATTLKVNNMEMFEESKEKSLKALERTINRNLEEQKQEFIKSIEVKDLSCKANDLLQMLELFYVKMRDPDHYDEEILEELIIDRLPDDLLAIDDNLIDRIARRASKIRRLEIGNMRNLSEEMKDKVFSLVKKILEHASNEHLRVLRLWNLGFNFEPEW